MEFLQIIEYMAISISLFFFGLGSLFDLKTREVADKVWWAYAPIGLALTAYRLFLNPSSLILTIVSVGVTFLISFGFFYFGLFGGADAKAIICLGLTLPLMPSSFQSVMGYVHPFFPIVVVITSYICSASVALWLFLKNSIVYLTGNHIFAGLELLSQDGKKLWHLSQVTL